MIHNNILKDSDVKKLYKNDYLYDSKQLICYICEFSSPVLALLQIRPMAMATKPVEMFGRLLVEKVFL